MKKIVVVGANGFVGKALCREIDARDDIEYVPITRDDNIEQKVSEAFCIIHAANSPRRFAAFKNPSKDYQESVVKTENFLKYAQKIGAKFILISSMSARCQLDHPYGINRKKCEEICLSEGSTLITRLGYMFSYDRVYGTLQDILEEKAVYFTSDSEYSYSHIKWNAKKIIDLVLEDAQGVFELGSDKGITLAEIAKILDKKPEFTNEYRDVQISQTKFSDSPSVDEFKEYLKGLK